MRLDKLLSQLKYGSRKEVKELVKSGKVTIGGNAVFQPETEVNPEKETIFLNDEAIFYKEKITLIMNKPQGTLSSNREAGKTTVIDLLKPPYDRFDFGIAGRLDQDADGLLILTNDGTLLHRIISPGKEVMKKYFVELELPLGDYSKLEKGVDLFNGKSEVFHTKPAIIEPIDEYRCYISISEGKFHQVKRMFAAIGNQVLRLKRTMIGNLELSENLFPGESRELEAAEIAMIFVKDSSQSV